MWHAGQPPLLLDQNWTLFEVTWRMDTCAKLGKWLYSVHRLPTPGAIIVFSDKWHMHTVQHPGKHETSTCWLHLYTVIHTYAFHIDTPVHTAIHTIHTTIHTPTHCHSHQYTLIYTHKYTLHFTPIHWNSHCYILPFTHTHTPVHIAMLFTYTCTHCHSHNCHPTPVHAAICQMALIQQTVSDNIKIV